MSAEKNKEQDAASTDENWWKGFKGAVEDPDVSIYEYIRDSIAESLELDEDAGINDFLREARRKTFQEILALKSPEEIKSKLETAEKNKLLFNSKTRAAIKLSRVLVDTFISAEAKVKAERKRKRWRRNKSTIDQEIEKLIQKKLADENIDESIELLASELEGTSKQEIKDTLQEAVRQLKDPVNIKKFSRDVLSISRKYMTLNNLANIAIHTLPLITWKYRWALAIGLGAYSARIAAYYGGKSIMSLFTGKVRRAKKYGRHAVTALKAATGNVLLIGLAPLTGKLPKMIMGAVGFLIKKTHEGVLTMFETMLRAEKKKAGSTPLSKKLEKGTRGFVNKNQDSLVTVTTDFMSNLAPSSVTKILAVISKRLPLTKAKKVCGDAKALCMSVTRRFDDDTDVLESVSKTADSMKVIKNDVADMGTDLKESMKESGLLYQGEDPTAAFNRETEAGSENADSVVVDTHVIDPLSDKTNTDDARPV